MKNSSEKIIAGKDTGEGIDLRPIANEIVRKTIQRMKLAHKESQKQPTVLVLGEQHQTASHMVVQMLVLKKLKESNVNFVIGTEDEHNFISEVFDHYTQRKVTGSARKHVSKKIADNDMDGKHSLSAFIGIHSEPGADLSHKTLYSFILNSGISTKFNDAVTKWDSYNLDMNDKITNKITKKIINTKKPIDATKPNGMYARNSIMVHHALSHAEANKAKLYVQICGTSHVLGDFDDKAPYRQSLTALFKKAACPVVAAQLSYLAIRTPNNAHKSLSKNEVIWGIDSPNNTFVGSDNPDEKEFLRKTLKASGLDPEICELNDEIKAHRTKMHKVFGRWKSAAKKQI